MSQIIQEGPINITYDHVSFKHLQTRIDISSIFYYYQCKEQLSFAALPAPDEVTGTATGNATGNGTGAETGNATGNLQAITIQVAHWDDADTPLLVKQVNINNEAIKEEFKKMQTNINFGTLAGIVCNKAKSFRRYEIKAGRRYFTHKLVENETRNGTRLTCLSIWPSCKLMEEFDGQTRKYFDLTGMINAKMIIQSGTEYVQVWVNDGNNNMVKKKYSRYFKKTSKHKHSRTLTQLMEALNHVINDNIKKYCHLIN